MIDMQEIYNKGICKKYARTIVCLLSEIGINKEQSEPLMKKISEMTSEDYLLGINVGSYIEEKRSIENMEDIKKMVIEKFFK